VLQWIKSHENRLRCWDECCHTSNEEAKVEFQEPLLMINKWLGSCRQTLWFITKAHVSLSCTMSTTDTYRK